VFSLSMTKSAPVHEVASSDARKTASAAMSSSRSAMPRVFWVASRRWHPRVRNDLATELDAEGCHVHGGGSGFPSRRRSSSSSFVVPRTDRMTEGGCQLESVVLLRQLRCVDRARLVRRLGTVRGPTLDAIDHALLITLGLVEL
jgi:hypothetical protein